MKKKGAQPGFEPGIPCNRETTQSKYLTSRPLSRYWERTLSILYRSLIIPRADAQTRLQLCCSCRNPILYTTPYKTVVHRGAVFPSDSKATPVSPRLPAVAVSLPHIPEGLLHESYLLAGSPSDYMRAYASVHHLPGESCLLIFSPKDSRSVQCTDVTLSIRTLAVVMWRPLLCVFRSTARFRDCLHA